MNLRWKQFEKRMRARVGQYDARRRMRFWQKVDHFLKNPATVPLWLGRAAVSTLFALIVVANRDALAAHPDLALAGLNLWILFVAVFRAGMIQNTAVVDPDYRTLWMLPLTVRRIFEHFAWRLVTGSCWVFFEILLVYCLLLGTSSPQPEWWIAAVICAGIQAALFITMTVWLVVWRIKEELAVFALAGVGLLLPFASESKLETFLAPALYVGNPFGWVNALYLQGWVRGDARAWWLVIPALGLLATLQMGSRLFRRLHEQGLFRVPRPRRAGPAIVADEPVKCPPADPGEQRRRIQSGGDFRPANWARFGPLERLIARGLTPREQIVAETLILSRPRWTRQFLGVLVYFALYLVANTQIKAESLEDLFLGIFRPGSGGAMSVIGFLASFVFFAMILAKVASLLLEFGVIEFVPYPSVNAGLGYRAFRLLPLNYWDVARTRAKITTLMMLALLPIVAIFSLSPACGIVFGGIPHAAGLAIKTWVLAWGAAMLLSSVRLVPLASNGPGFWKGVLKMILVCPAALLLGSAALATTTLLPGFSLTLLFVAGALAWLLYCGARYRRGL